MCFYTGPQQNALKKKQKTLCLVERCHYKLEGLRLTFLWHITVETWTWNQREPPTDWLVCEQPSRLRSQSHMSVPGLLLSVQHLAKHRKVDSCRLRTLVPGETLHIAVVRPLWGWEANNCSAEPQLQTSREKLRLVWSLRGHQLTLELHFICIHVIYISRLDPLLYVLSKRSLHGTKPGLIEDLFHVALEWKKLLRREANRRTWVRPRQLPLWRHFCFPSRPGLYLATDICGSGPGLDRLAGSRSSGWDQPVGPETLNHECATLSASQIQKDSLKPS